MNPTIGLDQTTCSRFSVSHDFGHPWTREKGWDLLEIEAESEEHLSEMIAQAEKEFWQTWIRDNCKAAMYKPTSMSKEWIDTIDLANDGGQP